MIFTDRIITVRKGESKINEPIIVYRGDYELEVRFVIMNSKFKFMSGTNLIESENAAYGQLAILTPYGGNIFSDVAKCNEGTVTFVLTKAMLDQIEEVGLYSFQIRLFDYNKESRVSIPPVEFGIEVREPITSEDHDNSVNNAIVGYSIAKIADALNEKVPDTFNGNGDYNKTIWETGDRITEGKLNKIEDALDKINQNEIDDVAALNKRITNNYNVLNANIELKANNSDLEAQKNRIDNIAKLESGSTTGDAELIDCRIGYTGIEYDSAGAAIREQNKILNDTIQDVMDYSAGNFTFEKIKLDAGFLMINGNFSSDSNIHSVYTSKIVCKPGWKFLYKGRGNEQAASWLLYSDDKIISYGQAEVPDSYVEVEIPSGINGIVFASYADIGNENIPFDVVFASVKTITTDNFDSMLLEAIQYEHLHTDLAAAFPTKHIDVRDELTEIDGKYLNQSGSLIDHEAYKVYELSVNKGEYYSYSGVTIYQLVAYAFYDSAGLVIDIGGNGNSSLSLISWNFEDIRVPDKAVMLRICSGDSAGSASFNITRLTIDDIPSMDGIERIVDDALDTHKYRNCSEYTSILGDYEVVSGEAYMNAGGKFVTDANSQYVKSIRIREYKDLYITAQARYNTCIMAIRNESGTLLGVKGSAALEGGTQTWEMSHFVVDDLLNEYPTAYYMDLCTYAYQTNPLGVFTTDGTFYDLVEKVNNIPSGSNVLYGKKWVACGDSFTEGDFSGYTDPNGLSGKNSPELYDSVRGMYKTYPWWIAERNNMVLINEAKCGSTMALSTDYINGTNDDINYRNPFSLNRYKEVPLDADYLTLWFGLNETSTPLGTLQDTDNTTILGAWNVVLEYFLTNMHYCKIGIVISDGWLNDTFANGVISVAEYWGIPYLDMRNNPQVPLMLGGRGGKITLNDKAKTLRNNAFYVTSSNGHPNLKAHEYQSTFIEHWLRSL